jgi:hypothetical protein
MHPTKIKKKSEVKFALQSARNVFLSESSADSEVDLQAYFGFDTQQEPTSLYWSSLFRSVFLNLWNVTVGGGGGGRSETMKQFEF